MASNATFVAYIDEAGDEGFKFGGGSSEWFVLGAAILRRRDEMPHVRLVDEVRARLNRGRKPEVQFPARKALHFRDLEHNIRKFYAARIARADLRSVVVLINKPDLLARMPSEAGVSETSHKRKIGKLLYTMAVVDLVEGISWHCHEQRGLDDDGDGSVDLVFSSRSTLDYEELKNVVSIILAEPDTYHYGGQEGIIRMDQVQAIMHSKSMGLQIADAVTSSYYYAVEPSADGFTEDGYVRLLLPCAYRKDGKVAGAGARFPHAHADRWPSILAEVSRWER